MSAPLHLRPDVEQQIRLLVEEGQIRKAQELLKSAGDRVPPGSKMREILGPARVRKSAVKGVDRSAEFHWLKTKAVEHPGKWVALVGEDLIASFGRTGWPGSPVASALPPPGVFIRRRGTLR